MNDHSFVFNNILVCFVGFSKKTRKNRFQNVRKIQKSNFRLLEIRKIDVLTDGRTDEYSQSEDFWLKKIRFLTQPCSHLLNNKLASTNVLFLFAVPSCFIRIEATMWVSEDSPFRSDFHVIYVLECFGTVWFFIFSNLCVRKKYLNCYK